MCGILGVVAKNAVNQVLYDGLLVLQHRGQDAAGIVTAEGATFHMHKGGGMVRDVFRTRNMRGLLGACGIGHTRYPTAGSAWSAAESQPFYVNSPFGIVLGHNGNLTNTDQLKSELFRQDLRHVNTNSDSEVLLNVLAHELQEGAANYKLDPATIFAAVSGVHRRCRGAYAVVAMIAGYGLLAFRDPYGIRPLVFGKMETEHGTEYLVSSESVALDALGFELVRDIAPGEAIFIDEDGHFYAQQCALNPIAESVHLRIRISRAAGFGDRRHFRVRDAPAHGREPRRQDQARTLAARHRRRDSDSGFEPPGRDAARQSSQPAVSRGLHQEPLHRPHLHHAGPGHTQEIGAAEAECDRHGIQGQERDARRRFDRARHHQPRNRADGARSRRAQGVFRVRGAAGAVRRTFTASTCRRATS